MGKGAGGGWLPSVLVGLDKNKTKTKQTIPEKKGRNSLGIILSSAPRELMSSLYLSAPASRQVYQVDLD